MQVDWTVLHHLLSRPPPSNTRHPIPPQVQPHSRKWDVISYQFGLHDLGCGTKEMIMPATQCCVCMPQHSLLPPPARPATHVRHVHALTLPPPTRSPRYDTERISLSQYSVLMTNITARLAAVQR